MWVDQVGAGPAGLILALSLLEQGVPTRIIDKETSHRVGAKGAGIMVRALCRHVGLHLTKWLSLGLKRYTNI